MNKMTLFSLLAMAGAALLPPLSASAQFGGAKIATVSAAVRPATVKRGGTGILVVTLTVKPKYHVNANKPNDTAYIPTELTVQPLPGIVLGPVHYPAPSLVKVSYSPKPLLVYQGQVTLTIPFAVAKAARPGVKMLIGSVSFQGCNASSCYPPASAPVKTDIAIK